MVRMVLIFLLLMPFNCNGCRKIYTNDSGIIISPRNGSSTEYPNNAQCIYIIKGRKERKIIEFTFRRFSTETCHDRLYINYDRFCGDIPRGTKEIYAFTKSMRLRFWSDHIGTRSGFEIKYELKDTCNEAHTGESGFISSPKGSFSSDYPNNIRCTYTIIGSRLKKFVEFTFERFTTQSGHDHLYINNDSFSGNLSGQTNRTYGFNGSLTLIFLSDSSKTETGFHISYKLKDCEDGYYGVGCESECSSGCLDVCSKETGRCNCEPGRTGTQCDDACPSGVYDSNCMDGYCNKEDGRCSCKPGYTGSRCDSKCPEDRHGVHCNLRCSAGCVDGVCHRESGYCGCLAGWSGTQCLQECDNGTYGEYCKHSCSIGCAKDDCDKINGSCICISGYQGDQCNNKTSQVVAVYAGSAFSLVSLLVLALVFITVRKRVKKNKPESVAMRITTKDDNLSRYDIPNELSERHVYEEIDDEVIYEEVREPEYETPIFSDPQKPAPMTAGETRKASRNDKVLICRSNKGGETADAFNVAASIENTKKESEYEII